MSLKMARFIRQADQRLQRVFKIIVVNCKGKKVSRCDIKIFECTLSKFTDKGVFSNNSSKFTFTRFHTFDEVSQ